MGHEKKQASNEMNTDDGLVRVDNNAPDVGKSGGFGSRVQSRLKTGAGATVLAIAAGLTGCGGGGDDPAAAQQANASTSAATPTEEANRLHWHPTIDECGNLANAPVQYTNVLEFGADRTGTNNSDQAFLNAISQAKANGTNRVCVPKGTYRIDSAQLNALADGFEFNTADGLQSATIIMGKGHSAGTNLFSTNGFKNVKIRNLAIRGENPAVSGAAIYVQAPTAGATNAEISNVSISNTNVAIRTSNDRPIDGLSIINSKASDLGSYGVVMNNVTNFTFTNNTMKNWKGDAVNYDMTSNVQNYNITGNTFRAGHDSVHAVVQGPYHPQFVVQGGSISNNTSYLPPDNAVPGQGAGFGVEFDKDATSGALAQITNNKIIYDPASPPPSPNTIPATFRNGIEAYGSNMIISGNTLDNGVLSLGAPVDGAPVSNVVIDSNTVVAKNPRGNDTLSGITFNGTAGGANSTGTDVSNVSITNNKVTVETAGPGGVIGVDVGRNDKDASGKVITGWNSVVGLNVTQNTVSQPKVNAAIRFKLPISKAGAILINSNDAKQGLQVRGESATPPEGAISGNDFSLSGIYTDTQTNLGGMKISANQCGPTPGQCR
jgi:hypothetical protein